VFVTGDNYWLLAIKGYLDCLAQGILTECLAQGILTDPWHMGYLQNFWHCGYIWTVWHRGILEDYLVTRKTYRLFGTGITYILFGTRHLQTACTGNSYRLLKGIQNLRHRLYLQTVRNMGYLQTVWYRVFSQIFDTLCNYSIYVRGYIF
jgi:hypothetical protein